MVNLTGRKRGGLKGDANFKTLRSIPILSSSVKLPKKLKLPPPSQVPPEKNIQFGPVFEEPFPTVLSTTLEDEELNIDTFCFPDMKLYLRDVSVLQKWKLFLDRGIDSPS